MVSRRTTRGTKKLAKVKNGFQKISAFKVKKTMKRKR